MKVRPLAGKPAEPSMLVNVPKLITAYYTDVPDLSVPAGFKWFVGGLLDGSLGFGGEESAGASFVRLDGTVWTTDKDGIAPALLSAEITARMGRDPGEIYRELTREFGEPIYDRVEAPASPEQKAMLERLSAQQVRHTDLAGEKIQSILTHAPGNGASIGGLKVMRRADGSRRVPQGRKISTRSMRRASWSGSSAPHLGGSADHRQRCFGCGAKDVTA